MNNRRSKQIEDAIIESLKNGATITDACKAAGVSRCSFFLWRREDVDLDAMVQEAIVSRVEIIEDVVYMAAKNGDVRAALEWLEHKAGWEKKLNIKGKFEHQINDPKDDDVIATAEAIIKASNST